jgi:hypothetical protein
MKIFAKTFAKTKIFVKTFAKTKIFHEIFAEISQLFVSYFREKRKLFFAKFYRKYENENFRFNPTQQRKQQEHLPPLASPSLDLNPFLLQIYILSHHLYPVATLSLLAAGQK